MNNRLILFVLFCLTSLSLSAQNIALDTTDIQNQRRQQMQEALLQWNTERRLDSIDQEKLPRTVSGGLLAAANVSNFIISNDEHTMSSYMRIGAEFGGFLDFSVTKHFAIQAQLVFTAEQNRFNDGQQYNRLWAFGVDIPVFFMGRYGNLDKGYLQFGAGPYAHFNFASNLGNMTSNEAKPDPLIPTTAPLRVEPLPNPEEYQSLYALHSNYAGLAVIIGYELPFGMQINAKYQVSLSDVFTYYEQNEGSPLADASIYPQYVSLGIAYRWR